MKDTLGYTVDSPFFSCKIEQYHTDEIKLTEFMKIMIKNMRQVCKDLKQCAKSIEIFGLHMQNGLKVLEDHFPVINLLKKFGEIFSEIASSQDILAVSLERSFTEPLEIFCLREVASTISMIQLYNNMRETGESAILKYLQSDIANFGRGLTQHQLEQRAYDVVQHKRKYETVRFDLISKINEVEALKSFAFSECCISGSFALRTHFHLCLDKLQSCENQFSEFQKAQHHERAVYIEDQKPVIRKRRDLTNVLDAMVERVELACPHLSGGVNINSADGSPPDRNSLGSPEEIPSQTQTPSNSSSWQNMTRIGVSWGANIIGNLTRQSQQIVNATLQGTDGSSHNSLHDGKPRISLTSAPSGHHEDMSHGSTPPTPFGTTCEECEARMKALDNSELVPLYQSGAIGELTSPEIVKQGYLWKRNEKHKMIEQWKRLWFVLDDTKLFYVSDPHEDGSYHAQTVCDLMLASVRERKGESDLPFSFEIAFANFESTVVQAEGQKEYLSWITELRNTIAKRLTSGDSASVIAKKTKQRRSSLHPTQDNTHIVEVQTRRRRNSEQIAQLFRSNLFCAECERDSPEWVSLNLGCLVCIDCSGVHRSMGVHISKMRSLTLDDLEAEEYRALQEAGNELSNSVWEAMVPKLVKKPDRNSSYSERDKFIRAKYEQRLFLNPPFQENLSPEELVHWVNVLIQGCVDGTPVDILNALAHGVDFSVDLRGKFPLHLACQKGSLICVYLLVMNGVDILVQNESGYTCHDLAEFHGHSDIASFLKKRQELAKVAPKRNEQTHSETLPINPVADTPFDNELPMDPLESDIAQILANEDNNLPSFPPPDPDNPFNDDDLKMI